MSPQTGKGNNDSSTIRIEALPDELTAASETLSWIIATFRYPLRSKLCSSQIKFGWSQELNCFHLGLLPLQEVRWSGPGTCWQPLFPSSVLALDFPVLQGTDFAGLQIPFGVMLDLAGILHYVDIKDAGAGDSGIYFFGLHSLLFPTAYIEDAETVHWHLIWHEKPTIAPGLIYDNEQAKDWHRTLDFSQLKSSTAILGYCRKSAILLGTESRLNSYGQLAPSRANQDIPPPEIGVTSTTVGISAMGLATAQLAVGAKYRTGLASGNNEINSSYSSVLESAKAQSVIIFDTENQNERAWLVPQLSVILDLVNKFACQLDSRPRIEFAAPIADGAAASELVLKNPDYANRVLRRAIVNDEKDNRVADIVKAIYAEMCKRAELDAGSERSARGTKELSREYLRGWDLLELCNPPMVSRQRRFNIHRTHLDDDVSVTPCWLPLANEIPVYFGRQVGELIVPDQPANVCGAWHPLPGGVRYNYLAASMICLSRISKAHGHEDCRRLLDDLAWDYVDKSLFKDCKKAEHDCKKKAQQLVKMREWEKKHLGDYSPKVQDEGAVVFANINSFWLKCLEVKEDFHKMVE